MSWNAAGATPKRILLLHSFGRGFEPYTSFSEAFRTQLAKELGQPVEFYDVALESVRFAGGASEGRLVDYLTSLFAEHPLDLVVSIGGPAVRFAQEHRTNLLAKIPMLISCVDDRLLNAGSLTTNDAAVACHHDPSLVLRHILELLPDTAHVAVVFGDSPLEKFWLGEFQREFQPFTHRVDFLWLGGLPFAELLQRAAELPAHSAIFYAIMTIDGHGVPYTQYQAITELHAVANAPLFGFHDTQMGIGVVGGPLLAIEEMSSKTARVAVRILGGETTSGIRTEVQVAGNPVYDWRELQRWNIPESRLPAGSTIRFRQPTLWESYKWSILGALAVLTLETLLMFFLVANSVKRRRAERAFRESEQRLNLAAAAAEIGMWMWNVASDEIWATENCRRMFGFPARAVIRYETFLQRVHPDDRAAVELAVRHALEDGNDYVSEYRVILPDGVERWVTARGRPEATGNGETKRLLGACVDVTTRKRAEETAQQLSGRLLHAHEEERARLAKELHDGLSQNLALLSVEMEMFGQRLPETSAQINERLSGFSREAKGLSAEVHRISHGLHPAKLTQLGLTVALGGFCREVERAHDIEVCFEARDVPRELPPEAALCLYRVAQEAIQNVVKHSGSKRATVELETTGNRICLVVTDDGKGFETGAERGSGSLGLVSMHERVRLLQGEVLVKSEPGQGTRVEARVPLPMEYRI